MKTISAYWFILAIGLALMTLGICIYIYPWGSFTYLVRFIGIALLINSFLLAAVYYHSPVKSVRSKWFFLIESILDMSFSILFLFSLFFTFIIYPLLFSTWAVSRGIIKAAILLINKSVFQSRPLLIIDNVVTILFGVLMLYYSFENTYDIVVDVAIFVLLISALNILVLFKHKRGDYDIAMLL